MISETRLLRLILKHRIIVFLFCFFASMYFTSLVIRESEIEYNSRKTYTTTMEMADPTTESWVRMIYLEAVSSDFVKSFEGAKSLSTEFGQSEFNAENVSSYVSNNVKIKVGKTPYKSTIIEVNHEDTLTPNLIVLPIIDISRESYFRKYQSSIMEMMKYSSSSFVYTNRELINDMVNRDIYKDDFIRSMKTIENTKNYFVSNKIMTYFFVVVLLVILYFLAIVYLKVRLNEMDRVSTGEWRLA